MSVYKETTFWQRFLQYLEMTDPSSLIYSDERVLEAKQWLEEHPEDDISGVLNSERDLNKKIVSATIHPATGEVIPRPFRVSAIAPVNIPLVFAMVTCPATNVPGTLFLHWLNQSYNTACNYANRSGADQSMESLMKAYGLAVTSACTLAYGLGKVAAKLGGSKIKGLNVLIPCLATAAANVSNIAFTRMDEITTGVSVFDSEGKVVGTSKTAGIQGVTQSALTRCVLVPCACLLFPPVIMSGLDKLRLVPKNPRLKLGLELAVIYAALQAALPGALAVFPQTAKIPVSSLEPQFHNLSDGKGNRYAYLYANKGL